MIRPSSLGHLCHYNSSVQDYILLAHGAELLPDGNIDMPPHNLLLF